MFQVSNRHSTELRMTAQESITHRMERRKKVVKRLNLREDRITMNEAALPEGRGETCQAIEILVRFYTSLRSVYARFYSRSYPR